MTTAKIPHTERLLEIVHALRTQCPWDREQTHRTLVPYLLEEAYETVEAIESGDRDALREELGDLLLQVVLHSEIASEVEGFGFEEVACGIGEKMVRRHPHVFGDKSPGDAKEHAKSWTELKQKERPKRSLLQGIPKSMPALALAQRYGEIASSVGFDWASPEGVLEKVEEERRELLAALESEAGKTGIEEELGDLLFTLANLARHLKLDAETALRKASVKFHDRFTRLEEKKTGEGKRLGECPPEELEAAWQQVKTEHTPY